MTDKKRITWYDIRDKLGEHSGNYMGMPQADYFRSALILTGHYQDELQIYEPIANQKNEFRPSGMVDSYLQTYIDAINEVAGDRQAKD